MRILHCLAWVAVALACAAPSCDTHDAPLGSGSGSSAWARMPSTSSGSPAEVGSGSAAHHEEVVHAMEAVTGASLDRPKTAAKPAKPKHGGGDSSGGGGNYGRTSSSPPPKPPEPELPESGRKLGQPCDDREQCASNLCEFDVCAKHYNDKLTKGEKCDYDNQCISDHCYMDECE
jgi:hypothetical protein